MSVSSSGIHGTKPEHTACAGAIFEKTGFDISICPFCGKGYLITKNLISWLFIPP